MSAISRYEDWLSEAKDDLKAAIHLKNGEMYGKACFFAQQAAEKALKALIMKVCKKYEETHSVVRLLRTAGKVLRVDAELMSCAKILDRHYLPPRYPNMWPSGAPHEFYSERDAEEAINCARKILEFVEQNIG